MDHKNNFYNTIVENLISKIILKEKINLSKQVNKESYWLICYDPSNTYDYCLNNNILLNKSNVIKKTFKGYQVVAILVD